jgi:hypothetical protein
VVDVVVYVSSVANPQKHSRKIQCLESFADGVRATGHTVKVEWEHKYTPSRLAVMLGWATTNTGGRNITLRKQIIPEQRRLGFQTMCIDASCWKYLDDHGNYLRYSLNGPFYDRAEYANRNSDATKWLEISRTLGVQLKPARVNQAGHILICMQRDGGFAMKTLDPMTWLHNKIHQIRSVSSRQIWVRPHPGQYNMTDFYYVHQQNGQKQNVVILEPTQSRLIDNLQGAHAAVFFNSSVPVWQQPVKVFLYLQMTPVVCLGQWPTKMLVKLKHQKHLPESNGCMIWPQHTGAMRRCTSRTHLSKVFALFVNLIRLNQVSHRLSHSQ